ncbi:MAG TPA: hypothetical protein EYM45_04220 [Verrucomicrobia bacterium]|nr:hypothetical protein [Verrucomicrobiota bacterium]
MNRISQLAAALLLLGVISTTDAARPGKISKVLQHWLDLQGRHTLSPSLLERDAYQAKLRADRTLCSGIRFDVKWAKNTSGTVKLQLELRVTGKAKPIVRELAVKPSRRGGWDAVTLEGDAFMAIGKIIAWRVRLLDGDIELAERRSFLWIESKPAGDAEKPAAD